MIPELGSFSIILALCFALIQAFAFFSFREGSLNLTAAIGQLFFLMIAMFCLIISFLMNDVTVIYVRDHSHVLLPFIYRVGAAWGGHEGSLLLWCLILSAWTVAFILFADRTLSFSFRIQIVRILGFVSAGFILFLFATSNPFQRDFPASPLLGNDLTPILQDPGLIFHPPMLYLGYVGFAVSFAFSVAALLQGKLDSHWARACRPWVILPWSCLSCGIVLGSWWAYRELGWGGWWFWDPVENASLLPWLSATALIHSLMVNEKRDSFKGWTLLLAIITFSLSLLGTFLVRSGVLVSVHAFANDPARGIFLLSYLALIILGTLVLYSMRVSRFYKAPHFSLFSRETFLLINTVILLAAVFTIVIGTLYPILLDGLGLGKISVGEPYFNLVFLPIILPILLLMGAAPHVRWQQDVIKKIAKKLRWTFCLSVSIGALSCPLAGFPFHWLTALGVSCAIWIILSTLQYTFRVRRLRYASMIIAHLGIAVMALGITINKSYSTERQIKISPGETTLLAGYQFTFTQVEKKQGTNYQSVITYFSVKKNQAAPQILSAEQRIYASHQESLSKPGILVNPWRDVYLVLSHPFPDGAWAVRIYYKPLVRWIWGGGFLLLIGGLLSLLSHWTSRREQYV